MATLLGADGPRTAGIVCIRGQTVVPPLPEAPADRVNRRKIDHIESEVCDVGEMCGRVLKCAAASGIGTARARKEFVPGAEPCPLAIDPDTERLGRCRAGSIRVGVHERGELVARRNPDVRCGFA